MQRKLVLVPSLGKKKSTGGTLTSLCGHPWKISLSVGTSLVDWNSVGVQNENQWLLSWGFINYRSNYQVTINLYSWSRLVWFNHLWHLQMGEARPRDSVRPSINSLAFPPAKAPWKKFRNREGVLAVPPPPPAPSEFFLYAEIIGHQN